MFLECIAQDEVFGALLQELEIHGKFLPKMVEDIYVSVKARLLVVKWNTDQKRFNMVKKKLWQSLRKINDKYLQSQVIKKKKRGVGLVNFYENITENIAD